MPNSDEVTWSCKVKKYTQMTISLVFTYFYILLKRNTITQAWNVLKIKYPTEGDCIMTWINGHMWAAYSHLVNID